MMSCRWGQAHVLYYFDRANTSMKIKPKETWWENIKELIESLSTIFVSFKNQLQTLLSRLLWSIQSWWSFSRHGNIFRGQKELCRLELIGFECQKCNCLSLLDVSCEYGQQTDLEVKNVSLYWIMVGAQGASLTVCCQCCGHLASSILAGAQPTALG